MKKYKPYLAMALILPILTLPFLGRSTFNGFIQVCYSYVLSFY